MINFGYSICNEFNVPVSFSEKGDKLFYEFEENANKMCKHLNGSGENSCIVKKFKLNHLDLLRTKKTYAGVAYYTNNPACWSLVD